MQNFEIRHSKRYNRASYAYYPADTAQMMKLEIDHRDGGLNYSSGSNEQRGIEMVMTKINVVEGLETYSPFDGVNGRILLTPTARYSARKIQEMAELMDGHAPEISAMWKVDRNAAIRLIGSIVSGEIAAKAA